MMLRTLTVLTTLMLMLPATAADSERPDHYEGLPAETLEVALANLSEYRATLAGVLARDPLSSADLNEVHRLTYTLENALERMTIDLHALAELLEVVHVASEQADAETVRSKGRAWIEGTRAFGR